jgi:hypothetical protein
LSWLAIALIIDYKYIAIEKSQKEKEVKKQEPEEEVVRRSRKEEPADKAVKKRRTSSSRKRKSPSRLPYESDASDYNLRSSPKKKDY